jgi:hypothetical protein
MKRMMLSCGIDDESAEHADECLSIDMNAVRTRCHNCPVTCLCDRWLGDEAVATNAFCPNAWSFRKAARTG